MINILKIKVIDGIPCIVLEDSIFYTQEFNEKLKKIYQPGKFTTFQQSKERAHYHKVLEELKRKFREK